MTLRLTRGNINSFLNDHSIFEFLKKNLHLLNGDVLDIGCGRMRYKEIILTGKNVKSYTGLDLEPGKFGYDSKADIYWDGRKIPITDNTYESAIIFEVLEHCADPLIVVSEAFRILKPRGIILFSTPFLYQLHGIPHDYQRLSPFGLKALFSKAGFTDMKIFGSGSWDGSLGQMISIWVSHRPMPKIIRRLLQAIFVPIFKILLKTDKKYIKEEPSENDIMPGILGMAYKP